jgi:hypothetical protein
LADHLEAIIDVVCFLRNGTRRLLSEFLWLDDFGFLALFLWSCHLVVDLEQSYPLGFQGNAIEAVSVVWLVPYAGDDSSFFVIGVPQVVILIGFLLRNKLVTADRQLLNLKLWH